MTATYRLVAKTPTSPAQVYTADSATDTMTSAGHGLVSGYAVKFATTGAAPTGITPGTEYFVVTVPDADTFTVSTTRGGSVLNITTNGTGTNTFVRNVWTIHNNDTGGQTIEDVSLQLWRDYLTWEAVPNSIDGATTPGLSTYKANAQATLAQQAASERAKWYPVGSDLWWTRRLTECKEAIADSYVVDIGAKPILEAEVGITDSTIHLVCDAIMAEWDAIEAGLAAIAAVERTAFYAIESAADNEDVDDAIAAISWP